MRNVIVVLVVGLLVVVGNVLAGTPGVDYSFGEWATDTGLPIGSVSVNAEWAGITIIEADDLMGMNNLEELFLAGNDISSIEAGAFSEKQNLYRLYIYTNPLVVLNLGGAQLRDLNHFSIRECPVDTVDMTNAEFSQLAFSTLMIGRGGLNRGIATEGVIEMDFSGANLSDVEQLNDLYTAIDLQELNIANVDFANTILNDNYDEVVFMINSLESRSLNYLTIDTTLYSARQSYFDDWDSVLFNELSVVPEPCSLILFALSGLTLYRTKKS
jgi:uncharacterized protein YjbI with pentapeptide repeats